MTEDGYLRFNLVYEFGPVPGLRYGTDRIYSIVNDPRIRKDHCVGFIDRDTWKIVPKKYKAFIRIAGYKLISAFQDSICLSILRG